MVTGIYQKPNGEWVVQTDKGDITCEYVVNAAGLWAPEVARMVGLEIPSISIAHTHILYEKIQAIDEADTYLPLVRDPDRSIYLRQEMDSLILGLYEANGQQWKRRGALGLCPGRTQSRPGQYFRLHRRQAWNGSPSWEKPVSNM
jgi:dimethylglycine dehydrogenase